MQSLIQYGKDISQRERKHNMVEFGVFSVPGTVRSIIDEIFYVKQMGFRVAEGYNGSLLPDPFAPGIWQLADTIRQVAVQEGVKVACLSVSADLFAEDAPQTVARLQRYAEVCARAGIPYLHHTLISGLKCAEASRPFEEVLPKVVSNARLVYDAAASVGVKTIYENQGFYINGAERYAKFYEQLDRPAGVVLDMANGFFAGENLDKFVDTFADRIVHVHLKDAMVTDRIPDGKNGFQLMDGRYYVAADLGCGDVHVEKAFRTLKKAGYSGCIMTEHVPKSEDPCNAQRMELQAAQAMWERL